MLHSSHKSLLLKRKKSGRMEKKQKNQGKDSEVKEISRKGE